MRNGQRVEVAFSFLLPKREIGLLKLVQSYLDGVGKIRSPNKDRISYTVTHKMSKGRLYMYNRDKTILYHFTEDVKEFSEYLRIYKANLNKHLTNGTYYLGKYSFSEELSSNVLKFKNLSLPELNLMLTKDREKSSSPR